MANSLKPIPLTCSGHTRPVVDLSYSNVLPDGRFYLISACKDGKPMLREGDTGDWVGTFEGHKGAVWSAVLSRDAARAATGSADYTAKIWDVQNGEELHTFVHKHIIRSVDFTQDALHLITGGAEKLIRRYDLNSPDSDPDVFTGHEKPVRDVVSSHNGKYIYSCSEDLTLRKWDIASGKDVKGKSFENPVSSIDLSSDGSHIIACYGKTVSLFDSDTFEEVRTIYLPCDVYSASLHPTEKRYLVAGGEDFKIYKYDIKCEEELESHKVHFGPVHCIRYSPDGQVYSSASEDGTIRLWQHDVGKTYGLWRYIEADCASRQSSESNISATPLLGEVSAVS